MAPHFVVMRLLMLRSAMWYKRLSRAMSRVVDCHPQDPARASFLMGPFVWVRYENTDSTPPFFVL